MINCVTLIGNVGKDPAYRKTDNSEVVNFTLATSEKYKGETKTEWHNIVIWGKLAGIVNQYVKKGQLLYLEGSIQSRSWDDKEGKKHYITEIVCYTMKMIGAKSNPSDHTNDSFQSANDQLKDSVDYGPDVNSETDGLPF